MDRRTVVAALAALLGGCTDRVHDLAASTPSDIDVRSRYVPDDPLIDAAGLTGRQNDTETHVSSFRSDTDAIGVLADDAVAARTFLEGTEFVDDGGRFVLLVVQRLASPGVDLRLGSVSRVGDRALRIGADEVGTVTDGEPVVHTLLIRIADERGPPERVTVSVEDDRVSVTV